MNTTAHTIASVALATGIYVTASSVAIASSALIVGIFLDIDHIIDFFLF
ncbi:MAG: hypothetical protein HY786_05135 [Deltaproteobacteria bacterium]|nr:hypothetical protein [Deltaproteobacteria bacterium]